MNEREAQCLLLIESIVRLVLKYADAKESDYRLTFHFYDESIIHDDFYVEKDCANKKIRVFLNSKKPDMWIIVVPKILERIKTHPTSSGHLN